jgi:hypothetical protein
MIKEYSKRLGAISPDRFQTALERLGLGDFVCASEDWQRSWIYRIKL